MIPVTARRKWTLLIGLLPIFAAILIYSVTWAFVWDEGFHLVAAQLIANGKTPYIDFCFPQTPLNAYLNAGLMLAFGDKWRVIHLFAALCLCGAVWLAAEFVFISLPAEKWRLPGALTAAALLGLNVVVMQFAPAGQAYAICILFITGAYRAATAAIYHRLPWFSLLAGVLAGAAIGSSLLTAPVPLVLLLWLWFLNRNGKRLMKALAYLAGCVIPFSPVIWLYIRAPRQTLFNVVQYQALFRRVNWGDANLRDFDTLTSWLASPDALLLAAFSIAGLAYLWRQRKMDDPFCLAAAIAGALVLFIAVAHPTFERYFILAVPFLSILGALGFWVLASRLATPEHPIPLAAVVIVLSALIWGRAVFDERDDERWSDYEEVAAKVAEVTPLGARLYADELIFFLLQRTPPPGMEFSYAEHLDLPPDQEKLFHLVSLTKLKPQVKAGEFATLQTCRDYLLENFEPEKAFKHHEEPADCDVFWGPKGNAGDKGKK